MLAHVMLGATVGSKRWLLVAKTNLLGASERRRREEPGGVVGKRSLLLLKRVLLLQV